MATLHVRNVPEPLYEALRRCAEENGRSIGGQAVALLNESLSTGRRGFPFFSRRAAAVTSPFQAFEADARSAVVDAQAIARELGQDHVGSEHLLLALIANPASAVARALAESPHRLGADAVRQRLEAGSVEAPRMVPFGPDAKKALELALRESLAVRAPAVQPAHLLLGIARAGGKGAEILADLGLGLDALRLALLTVPSAGPLPAFRVIELEGTAAEWADQLNQACEGPYELVEIVGGRAILGLRRP